MWIAHDIRDTVVDCINHWADRTEIPSAQLLRWIELSPRKFRDWNSRYGKVNEHNRLIPRDHWLEQWERQAIIRFFDQYPLEGYRRLAFMMLDRDIVAASSSSVYRVLKGAGLIDSLKQKSSRRGLGFQQPLQPHEHWHIDFSFINIGSTFYYLCAVLDGCSRYIVAWDIRVSMREADAEIVLQRAREKFPQARPRIISDRGAQFVSKDFKEFIRLWQTAHVLTSAHYPQSNGKLERFHRTLKEQAIRPKTPLTQDDAKRITGEFIDHYNHVRLHSAIGYIAPGDRLENKQQTIFAARDHKLESARKNRAVKRQNQTRLVA
jgi:putative transposase